MNFSNHARDIRNRLVRSLRSGNKSLIVKQLAECVSSAKSLLSFTSSGNHWSEDFNFWLDQMGSTNIADIPMTKFGVEEARASLEETTDFDHPRIALRGMVLHACLYLLTYSQEDDQCPFQTPYHYYFFVPERVVFKLSDLGLSDLRCERQPTHRSDVRIAKTSDLRLAQEELV